MDEHPTRSGKQLWAIAKKQVKVIAKFHTLKRLNL